MPSGPFEPKTIEELEQIVAWAVAEEVALEVAGAGTKRSLGRPMEVRRLLTTKRLAGIDMYEPDELVMSAGAGTPLAEIEAALAAKGQMLAFEPADYGAILGGEPGRQTIGGALAANLSGPRRIKAGAARDHLLGLQLVTGHGQIVKTGGRVVKNVTGYDLCKLLTGSMGTLAVMSHVTFKVLPAPETSGTLALSGAEETVLLAALRRAMGTSFDVSGAAMLPSLAAGRSTVEGVRRPGKAVAVMRVEGPGPSVAYRLDGLSRALADLGGTIASIGHEDSQRLWREVRDLELLPRGRPLWRLSMAPSHAHGLAEWLGQLSPERLYDWSGGLIWVAVKEAWADASLTIRKALEGRGGHATLVRADTAIREKVEVFQPQPPALRALTERVKRSFDPKHVLNPGRMYEGI